MKSLILCLGLAAAAHCSGQVKKILVQPHTQSAAYQALNKPSANQAAHNQQYIPVAGQASAIGFQQMDPGCSGTACQDIAIRYEIPGYVFLDRILLAGTIQNQIGRLLDEQQVWQNMSTASNQTKQQMNSLLQAQIDKLQSILDDMANACKPVDFASYAARITADVRYNDPITGSMGLMRANGNGDLNVMDLFDGVPFSALDASPVKASILIYKK